ncbi:PhzF family phenazine biosynthesis protein [Streptomyces paludis]|uniref:PhzF family phenazine biosynthesis isomerase n=1 Tax=Streptomyces paludis TaxID=2282738 RepID=A0A345HQY6_9ACTN|nr:PhzF family phenazine biosynthesis isomerase [Streptomyces paludis]AXG79110.1 PhzF family phenazine biosynthesis isomerase [Streptomyces paludis]
MTVDVAVLRYAAFTTDPAGGNPAGVVLDATGMDEAVMARTAAEVGYSETAFVVPRAEADENTGGGVLDVRYFSPLAEVPFCGHATIATAVAYARVHGVGELTFHTAAGEVPVATRIAPDGSVVAALVSVAPRTVPLTDPQLDALLGALRWSCDDLDPALPPRVAYAGAWHPVIAAASRERLADLDYDMDALGGLMAEHDWTTVDLVWRESPTRYHARNPFPPGGVVEDPATGAAAAALGGYLRGQGLTGPPGTGRFTVLQGYDMGRPSSIEVMVPEGADSGVTVTGTAVPIA